MSAAARAGGAVTADDFSDVARAAASRDAVCMVLRLAGAEQPDRSGRLPCPVHTGEHRNFVVLERGFHCHVCGASGSAVELVRLLYFPGLSERDGRVSAIRWLAPHLGIELGAAPLAAAERPTPRPVAVARELAELRTAGCIPSSAGDVLHGLDLGWIAAGGDASRDVTTPADRGELLDFLHASWLPCELEAAGLWRRGAFVVPEDRACRLRLRRDGTGAPIALQVLELTMPAVPLEAVA